MESSIEPTTMINRLWAKTNPFHPLHCHMIDTGCVARAILENSPYIVERFCDATGCPRPSAANWLAYLTALHDIGKCHASFQAKGPDTLLTPLREAGLICTELNGKFRHEALSARWLMDYLVDELCWPKPEALTVSAAIRGHHGDFLADDPVEELSLQRKQWAPLRRQLQNIVRSAFAPSDWQPRFQDHSSAGVLLSGLVVLSDWIASNEQLLPWTGSGMDCESYAALSGERARAAVTRLGLHLSPPWPAGLPFGEVWKAEDFRQPRPIQARCEELCREGIRPGMAIIEAPMGEGKTEAAVYLAIQWLAITGQKGLYMALPTAATSNQMYGRLKAFLEWHDPAAAATARLVHGMAWMLDEATPDGSPELSDGSAHAQEMASEWFRPKKRSLLTSYGVGTIDQALMSVLHVKHGFLRLFGLVGKVLVVDEVHAYDAYMSQILTLLLRWCGVLRIPVILLSATLPEERRRSLLAAYDPDGMGEASPREGQAPYPLLTFTRGGRRPLEDAVTGSARNLTVRLVKHTGLLGNAAGVAREVWTSAKHGGCYCVIANTVDSAQQIFRELRLLLDEEGREDVLLLLFHARFRAGVRQDIEERTTELFGKRSLLPPGNPQRTERPRCAILVATQVVEQSLDLDFDEMFTEIAPVDLLLQRAGRLHRHYRPERPTGDEARLHLLAPGEGRPEFGSTERVYHRFVLLKTLISLEPHGTLRLPVDIRPLVEQVYDGRAEPGPKKEVVDLKDLLDAWSDLAARTKDEGEKAKLFLIPGPSRQAFKLARVPTGPFDEHQGEARSYFAAKTRLGDDTQTVLVLDELAFADDLVGKHQPHRGTLIQLFLNKVDLPRWWVRKAVPEEGYMPIETAPSWLPGAVILRLRDGCWRGRDEKGKTFVIREDAELGLVRQQE